MAMDGARKKKAIYIGVAVLCLVGAWFSYSMLSDNGPKQTPKLTDAEAKTKAMQQEMAAEQDKSPKPPPMVATPAEPFRRGSVKVGK